MASEHGTKTRYNNGCRCDECKNASRKYDQQRRLRSKAIAAGGTAPTRIKTALLEPETDEPGRVEAGVLAEIEGLSTAESRQGLVEVAVALARVLDKPLAISQHPAAAHRLSETLDKLRQGADQKAGKLATVRAMTRKATG